MANTFPSSGFVGIGTASPNYLLDIPSNNNLYLSNLYITGCTLNPILSSGGTGGSMCLQGGGAGEGAIRLQGASSNSNGHISFLTNQVEAMRIITGGNVGIGTSSPSGYGHGGTNRILEIFNCNTSANAQSHIILTSGATTNPGSFGSITWAGSNYSSANRAGIIAVSTETGATTIPQSFMQFYTSDGTSGILERMRITSTGNVGIGTGSPTMPLTFADALGGKILLNANSNNYSIGLAAGVVSVDASMKFTAGCSTPGDFTFYRGSTLSMIIACTGNVGIGTTAPADKLHIIGADNGITICSLSANRPVFSLYNGSSLMLKLSANGVYGAIADNSGSDVMYFKGGCVSIGTSTPSYKLHVNGTFYAAGSSQDYKQSICNYNTDSCMFMKLKPVTYQYKEEYCHLGKELKSGTQIGLIAEEVAETYPELAILVNEAENKVVRNVDYEKLSVILLSEVQKLRKEVDDLKHK